VRFEAPSTATKISASRISPVVGSAIPIRLPEIVYERLFSGDMVLAHHRRQPSFEPAKQIAETAVAIALAMDLSVFFPEDHHRHAGSFQLARQFRPLRLDSPPLARRDPGPPKEPMFQSLLGDVVG
jgi:hypothetical protein